MKPFFVPLMVLVCALAGCTPKTDPEQAAVFASIQENLKAMESKDIDGVMATVHPETPNFAATRAVIQDIFSKFDLKYELRDLKLISIQNGEAKVSFVQKTMGAGTPGFTDNLVEGVHTLKKDGGKWKLLRMDIVRSTPLPPPQ